MPDKLQNKLDDIFVKMAVCNKLDKDKRLKKMEYLLRLGADINGWDVEGKTALQQVCFYNNSIYCCIVGSHLDFLF